MKKKTKGSITQSSNSDHGVIGVVGVVGIAGVHPRVGTPGSNPQSQGALAPGRLLSSSSLLLGSATLLQGAGDVQEGVPGVVHPKHVGRVTARFRSTVLIGRSASGLPPWGSWTKLGEGGEAAEEGDDTSYTDQVWQDLEAFTEEQVPRCCRFFAQNDTEYCSCCRYEQLQQHGTHKLWLASRLHGLALAGQSSSAQTWEKSVFRFKHSKIPRG